MRFLIKIVFLLFAINVFAQLELCQGIKGELVFHDDFGEGLGIGNPMGSDVTTYEYTEFFPENGQYTIRSNSLPNLETLPDPDSWMWHLLANDWSSVLSSSPGKMMLVNANEISEVIYKKRIENLCELSTYEFSLWIASLYRTSSGNCTENGGLGIPVNIKLEVWDTSETQLLSSAETGTINNSAILNFNQYGLLFTTLSGQTEVVVKLINNSNQPGCGNDFVLDEIKVQVCGGSSNLSTIEYGDQNPIFCKEDTPLDFNLNIENLNQGSFFLWQTSENGDVWENIENTPLLNTGGDFSINLTDVDSTSYYRVMFATTENNLLNEQCVWFSNIYFLRVLSNTDAPVPFFSELTYCGESEIPALAVMPVQNLTVDWYDSPTGGNLLLSNSFNYVPSGPGVYYAAYSSPDFPCLGDIRTPITLIWYPGITVSTNPPPITICGGEGVELDAIHPNSIYEWEPSSLGNDQTAVVYEPGLYVVTIRDPLNPCSEARTRTFVVEGFQNPEILNISHQGTTIYITMSNEDIYEYSLDGTLWQNANFFENVEPGLITVYVRDLIDCGTDQQEYFFLGEPPRFFTPNGDNYNDFFTLKLLDELDLKVHVFDRYGKLITVLSSQNREWNGMFNGRKLPTSDYWYKVYKDDKMILSGHFSLKR